LEDVPGDPAANQFGLIFMRNLLITAGKIRRVGIQEVVRGDSDGLKHIPVNLRIHLQPTVKDWQLDSHIRKLGLLSLGYALAAKDSC
jgi:hypothetical protein